MFHQIFLPPQVKWSVIITNKHDIQDLPHDLLYDATSHENQPVSNILSMNLVAATN